MIPFDSVGQFTMPPFEGGITVFKQPFALQTKDRSPVNSVRRNPGAYIENHERAR